MNNQHKILLGKFQIKVWVVQTPGKGGCILEIGRQGRNREESCGHESSE